LKLNDRRVNLGGSSTPWSSVYVYRIGRSTSRRGIPMVERSKLRSR